MEHEYLINYVLSIHDEFVAIRAIINYFTK